MTQTHYSQHGLFHITTNTKDGIPWLTLNGVPTILINSLFINRDIQNAQVYAFCILSNHMHILLNPGIRGLSKFIQSFKCNSNRDFHASLKRRTRDDGDNAALPRRTPHRAVACAESEAFCIHPSDLCWKKGYYDRHIKTKRQRANSIRYIHNNALHHKLVSDSNEWPWTSLNFKNLIDPLDIWLE